MARSSSIAAVGEERYKTRSEHLASFIEHAAWEGISPAAREALKIRVLDSLGCAFGALNGIPVRLIRENTEEFGGNPLCTLIGGGRTAPDRAAFYNGALIRYLDFNDSYLAKGETCHPSDNIGAVLAASEYSLGSGRQFLTALAVAYQVHCRLSDVAPVRARGFDHTTQGAFAAAAGAAKALELPAPQIANALGISGTANNALRVTRTGELSHWKGLAYPNTAFDALRAAFLAMGGITGPREVFEGNKGWCQTISGDFEIDWPRENLERVNRTILKKYNAEIHSQSAIEGMIELMREAGFSGREIDRIHIDIFDVAHLIIGGGVEGDKTIVRTKEEADHSLQYMVSVAALDGQVMPDQDEPERILSDDVQSLLRRVKVVPDPVFTRRFPDEHACRLVVTLKDGRTFTREKSDYEGFHTRPASWAKAEEKFHGLAEGTVDVFRREEIVSAVRHLDDISVKNLVELLG
ncbi:MAG TPA: MmgE/PrpD family protein [Candidatus Limnocylindrales bacterium]|nr:MmgE/PrpD family protein [Candidatus Limnocylindrales bacterium]